MTFKRLVSCFVLSSCCFALEGSYTLRMPDVRQPHSVYWKLGLIFLLLCIAMVTYALARKKRLVWGQSSRGLDDCWQHPSPDPAPESALKNGDAFSSKVPVVTFSEIEKKKIEEEARRRFSRGL